MCMPLQDMRDLTIGQAMRKAMEPEQPQQPKTGSWTGAINRARPALLIGTDTI